MSDPRGRLTAAIEIFDLGIDGRSVPDDVLRRIRIIGIATLAMCAIGAASVLQFQRLGLPRVSLGIAIAMALGIANLELLRRTRRPTLCGHTALALLASLLVATTTMTGGFHDPNFSWFYVLPVTAAVVLDLRGASIWLGITLGIALGFWSLAEQGVPYDRIPEVLRDGQALFSRMTAILALGFVATSFVIGQRRAERGLARANEGLRREAAYVQLLEHAAVASNEALSLEDALRAGVKRICTTMGWPVGHVYLVGEDGCLHASRVTYVEEADHFRALREKTLRTSYAPGEGMPGEALASGRPIARHDLMNEGDPQGRRGALARKLGLETAFAVPVLVHGRVCAVLEFATRERLNPNGRLLDVLAHVGIQIGRVGERTALQERLRQSQRMEAVGRLAAGVAHELNNPMAYVRSNLNQLRSEWEALRKQLDETGSAAAFAERLDECGELIEESRDGVERTVAIVREMKAFSQGTRGREPASLREVVEGALRVASARRPPGVRLAQQHADDLPPIPCAANQLHQVVLNLVVNAIEAVGESGEVRVATRREDAWAVIRVEDDGPGIPPAERERLFDPFFTTKAGGTGLGLSISYEIVSRHGGEIRVHSPPRSGTAMEVRLPIEGAAAA